MHLDRLELGFIIVHTSLIVSYFFTFLLFWAPLCLVVGAKKYFFGALYKISDAHVHVVAATF